MTYEFGLRIGYFDHFTLLEFGHSFTEKVKWLLITEKRLLNKNMVCMIRFGVFAKTE